MPNVIKKQEAMRRTTPTPGKIASDRSILECAYSEFDEGLEEDISAMRQVVLDSYAKRQGICKPGVGVSAVSICYVHCSNKLV